MPIRRSAAPLALLAALALAGCTAPEPEPEPTPTTAPTTEPLFASEEEALAAAEEAYREYVLTVEQALQSADSSEVDLAGLASETVANQQNAGIESYRSSGLRAIGSSTFDYVSTQSTDLAAADRSPVIAIYLCRDVAGTDVVDAEGNSVVTEDRQELIPFEVTFSRFGDSLIVETDELWSGENFC